MGCWPVRTGGFGLVHPHDRLTVQPATKGRRPRVFVSHSSHTPDALSQLDELVEGLRSGEDGVEVLYDREYIEASDRWREVINALLAECDAAIILVTPDALTSSWMIKEATILRWRYDRDTDFQILVSASVDRGELKKNRHWNPIDLPEIQFLPSGSAAETASAAKKKLAGLAAQLCSTPLDLLADEIKGQLSDAYPRHLQAALDSLNEEVPFELGDKHERLAYALARWILRQPPPALRRMAETLTLLGNTFPAENAREILDLMAPMWVELDAASWFLRAGWQHGPELRDIAISCKQPALTLRQYIDRAYMSRKSPKIRLLNGVTGGAQSEDVAQELRAVLRPELEAAWRSQLTDAEIDDRLSRTENRYYIALRLPDDRQVVTTLQERYPRVTFVFFADSAVPFDEETPVAAGVGWVTPRLDQIIEDHVSLDYADAWARFYD